MQLCEIITPNLTPNIAADPAVDATPPSEKSAVYRVRVDDVTYPIQFLHVGQGTYTVGIPFRDVPAPKRIAQAHQLFAEVVKAIHKFITEHRPNRIEINPASESRQKLYRRLFWRFGPQLQSAGYLVNEKPNGGFTVARQHQVVEMSMQELRTAESLIERFFRDLNIDVQWSKHFVVRVLDGGREENVTVPELAEAFAKMKRKYGQQLQQAREQGRDFLAVLQDLGTKLNIVFDIDFHPGSQALPHKYVLHGITLMRKNPREFRPNQRGTTVLRVESAEPKNSKKKRKRKFNWADDQEARARSIGQVWLATAADAT